MGDRSLSECFLAVVGVDPTEDVDDARYGAPVVPKTWEVTRQADGWWTLRTGGDGGGDELAVWRASVVGSEALWAVWGPRARLDAIAAGEPRMMPGREAWARRSEAGVRAWLRYWPVWRCNVTERDGEGGYVSSTGVVRRLVPDGVQLPDPTVKPFPWLLRADGSETLVISEAVIRVDGLQRPAMSGTLAGRGLHVVTEAQPDRRDESGGE